MTQTIIDPLAIVSHGIISSAGESLNPFTIVSLGISVVLTETIIEVPIYIPPAGGGGGMASFPHKLHTKKKKRITASATIDGTVYTSSVETEDLRITVNDTDVKIIYENLEPKLLLTLIKGK